MSDLLSRLDKLAKRFQGVDLKYRAGKNIWVARNLCSVNQDGGYRVEVTGATAAEAMSRLLLIIDRIDKDKGAKP